MKRPPARAAKLDLNLTPRGLGWRRPASGAAYAAARRSSDRHSHSISWSRRRYAGVLLTSSHPLAGIYRTGVGFPGAALRGPPRAQEDNERPVRRSPSEDRRGGRRRDSLRGWPVPRRVGTSAGCAESRLSGSAVAEPSSAPTRSGPCSRKRAGDGGRSPGARPVLRMRRPLPAVAAKHARESASRNAPALSALSAPRYADEANRGDARLVASAVHPIGARRARCDLGSRFPCPLRAAREDAPLNEGLMLAGSESERHGTGLG